ncbi:hypothetical protein HIM_04642 [Hirsutella minnesotensis 3608]|uniref:Major facilitator superfamily (MFS) profile domain-containing protein n=1 Tax=Hirsutella minnesotensis 3608 TaxID=1043627 RepID=A0A0F7ZV14_9HYPO|nr:hypothetical protein HIM_04642 [Hirsutella minnesotensis 3608]
MTTDEWTLLLSPPSTSSKKRLAPWLRSAWSTENRILLAGFLVVLIFSSTQVPLWYAFRLMECDSFYDSYPPYEGAGDRCSRDEIAAGAAAHYSILNMMVTLCGTANLFVAGAVVKQFGPRAALVMQTAAPAVRVSFQILGIMAGKRTGMAIIKATQFFTILGGPSGFVLVVNILAGQLVQPARQTAIFGRLQGCIMLGRGAGYLLGGLIGNAFGVKMPFKVAFVCFILAVPYTRYAIPCVSHNPVSGGRNPSLQCPSGLLAPIKILIPQCLQRPDGRIIRYYGTLVLCSGIFIRVVATGYAPSLIQLYATAAFGFGQSDIGWLMSELAITQALFLILLFPCVIACGRRWMASYPSKVAQERPDRSDEPYGPSLPDLSGDLNDTAAAPVTEEPPPKVLGLGQRREDYYFDLTILRWSLVIDGGLTTIPAFATHRWHIYLAVLFLSLLSGSAPAAKGVMTKICDESQRTDALNAVMLVESVARLTSEGLFGFIFSSLAQVGKGYAAFFCTAAVAVAGVPILLLLDLPPLGSKPIEDVASNG